MQLVIYEPTDDQFIKNISFNDQEIKAELAQRLEKYKGLVYSESSIKDAKSDRANLNKFKDAIETRRKEIKKQCLKPYEDFEAKIKEIVAMIDQPILAIDGQIKAFEQAKKDKKTETIKGIYADSAGGLTELVHFDKVFNPRWLNVTCKVSEIQKEITELFAKIEADLKVITELQSEYELQIKDTYLRCFDLTAALQEKKRLEEQAARLAEHKRQQEEKKRQDADQATPQAQSEIKFTQEKEQPAEQLFAEPEKFMQVDFRVWATNEQLQALGQYMRSSGIKYGKVPTDEREVI